MQATEQCPDCPQQGTSGGAIVPYHTQTHYNHSYQPPNQAPNQGFQHYAHQAGQHFDNGLGNFTLGMTEGATYVPRQAEHITRRTFRNERGLLAGVGFALGAVCMIVGAIHVFPWSGQKVANAAQGGLAAAVGYRVPASAPGEMRLFNALGHGTGTFGKAILTGAGTASAEAIQVQYVPGNQGSSTHSPSRIQSRPGAGGNGAILPVYQATAGR